MTLEMKDREKGEIEVELEGIQYSLQYEVSNQIENWFDLTIWLNGESISERVPRYTESLAEDIKSPHAVVLLEKLLEHD